MSESLGEKTWHEAKELAEKNAIAVVPIGAFEQHGKHLPLDTDMRLVTMVANRSAQIVKSKGIPIVVTPPVWTAFSPHHMNFSGTITLSMSSFVNVLQDICRCLNQHGFKKIFLLNGHGGNTNIIRSVIQALFLEEGIRVTAASYWDFALEFIKEWRTSLPGGIDHACEMETALMLHLFQELVKKEAIKDARWFPETKYLTGDLTIGGVVATAFSLDEISSTGVAGSPEAATALKGQELFDEIILSVAEFWQEFHSWDWHQIDRKSTRLNSSHH